MAVISYQEAQSILKQHHISPKVRCVPLLDAIGYVAAEDIHAISSVPPFRQSAVDGYAVRYSLWNKIDSLVVKGEIAAGKYTLEHVDELAAYRIFTGAMVPDAMDTVVMQEKVTMADDAISVQDPLLKEGSNVRAMGSEVSEGTLLLHKGSIIHHNAVGYLASAGAHNVMVYAPPSVAIIVTGNELVAPGQHLMVGQIYESNSVALVAALRTLGVKDIEVTYVADDEKKLIDVVSENLEKAQLILITGGVSVGKYDFVVNACTQCGVQPLFHKISQKPGKPLFAGRFNQKVVFGLPGNPASVFTCFHIYIKPLISHMMQRSGEFINTARLKDGYKKETALTHFLKGHFDGQSVEILEGQESYKMSSFSYANCIVQIDDNQFVVTEDTDVIIHLINHA